MIDCPHATTEVCPTTNRRYCIDCGTDMEPNNPIIYHAYHYQGRVHWWWEIDGINPKSGPFDNQEECKRSAETFLAKIRAAGIKV